MPLALTTLTTAPFVTYVHLVLPAWARASAPRLHRYAAALPSTAQIDITTLRFVFPRVTRVAGGELSFSNGVAGVGPLTLRRNVPEAAAAGRKWWAWKPLKRFYVAGMGGGKIAEQGVWEAVVGSIARGFKEGRRW